MPAANPLLAYLHDLHAIHASGAAVKETSYYGALEALLNGYGAQLKPRVRCIIHLKNTGAGIPDGGLFSADQLLKGAPTDMLSGPTPARGVIEVKSTSEEVTKVAFSEQVKKYLAQYGQVLVTNYRDFVLVQQNEHGQPQLGEQYRLAANETVFWAALPQIVAQQHAAPFAEYIQRVMVSNAPLQSPRDVAWFLASYARDAKTRIEAVDMPALHPIRRAMEDALGITFAGERGEHFFRSTLVQTLFYGLFSAWVLWHNEDAERTDQFDWRTAAYYLHVPVIQALFEQLAQPTKIKSLHLAELLGWTGAALNRVNRQAFFATFQTDQAVQYFYEPFLEAFDPELRRDLGVWYTPPEIIEYMVARVDTALREELGIADGLADSRVFVLDPCCGTGAYLVAVLKRIAATLAAQGEDALLGEAIKRAATSRVFGFELLPAAFVVAHLQLGLLLQQRHAPLAEDGSERVAVYLTNALTGWEPPDAAKTQYIQQSLAGLPGLQEERDSAARIKRDVPILVVLGNPPYSGFAGIAGMEEERDLSHAYRTTQRAPKPQGQGLNDLYVRFFRMAERRIVEGGQGVVCFISNYSWLDGLSFTGMRERYLHAFDQIWIDNLNGDKYKTGKLTPEGAPDPSVFSTPFNPEGIQVGTAVALFVRTNGHATPATLHFRHLWGRNKRTELLQSVEHVSLAAYQTLQPPLALGLPFTPTTTAADYLSWPLLPELFPVSFPGVKTSRDDVVVDIDRERLEQRMRQYFDPAISHAQMRQIAPGAMESDSSFNAEATRTYLQKRGFLPENIVRYAYRPFDLRWLYWEPETKLLDRNRAEYWPHVFKENLWMPAVQQNRKQFDPPFSTTQLTSGHIIERGANMFPLLLANQTQQTLFDAPSDGTLQPNLSDKARAYLDGMAASAEELFFHAIAVLHAPTYRAENSGALRQDWPRIPLPATAATLRASAALGRTVAALLDTERPVVGVTNGAIRSELLPLGKLTQTTPNTPLDLRLSAGWGHGGNGNPVMPGRGKIAENREPALENQEPRTENPPDNRDGSQFSVLGSSSSVLGSSSYDVYLNTQTYWQHIPAPVWNYTIGGYQVIKKWLSYREHAVLGRALTSDEAREVTAMVRRIAALLFLAPTLDANYRTAVETTP